jgi:hypothetical protein
MNKLIILIFCFNLALTLSAQNFVRTSVSNKNVLLESFTGVNCFYCAGADAAAAAVQNAHPDSVIWINIHAGIFAEPGGNRPDFRSPYADTLLSFSGLTVFPAAMINRRLLPDFAQNTGKLAIESFNWSTVTDTILIETSPVNIAARSEFNISTRILKVVVESYYTGNSINSQNRLFAALLLDSVLATQEGARVFNPSAIGSDGRYMHRNILFDYINSATYITNTNSGSFRADTFYYSIPADFNGTSFDLTSPKVAVWITENDSANVLNAAYSEMTFVSDFSNSAGLLSTDWDADFNLLCGTESAAEISIVNLGNNAIDSISVDYSVNSGTVQSLNANLSSPLTIGKMQKIQLPVIGGLSSFGNAVSMKINLVNSAVNPVSSEIISQLNQAQVMVSDSTNGVLTVRFDNYPEDISWSLIDETDALTILSDSNYVITNSIISQNFTAVNGHCYAFKMTDSYGDGLCCGSGQGYYELKIGNLRILRENEFTFESGTKFNFEEGVIAINPTENIDFDFDVFPNPANAFLNIKLKGELNSENSYLTISNALGQLVATESINFLSTGALFQISTESFLPGVYFLQLHKDLNVTTKKIVISR